MSGEKCFPPIPVGSFVVIAVPEVDRDKIDVKNILVIEIIMDVTDDEYYKVGCESGITDSLYSRNQMSMCKENFVSQETFNIPCPNSGIHDQKAGIISIHDLRLASHVP
ncbi:hypothetical protein ILUMI_13771 [Ignelater luminosus]|uniref:Uncharacterized protein n=1 Tax=Ignelater luminosus TaxID=2038154 RepID=A0A8K0CXV0_IGNLU|nr:hypothetical protein ILUMI_13771 [Ignelater luminosus]